MMINQHLFRLGLGFVLCFSAGCHLQSSDQSLTWESVSFTFPIKDAKDEVKETKVTVRLPKNEQTSPIRGVILANDNFTEVAHKHNLAVLNLYDEGNSRGPSIKFLAAAATACKRPEIEFAGAVVIGCSARGRQAAQWAGFNHKRTLAVFLDHSAAGAVDTKPSYDYMNLPIVPGVPMCFSETRDDLHQNIDRRAGHYNWCTTAFRDHQQPCTTSIYYVSSKHCEVKSRELQAVWLDEALEWRIPALIPIGQAYALNPVSIKTGGLVKADLAKDDTGRTYHDNVIVGPAHKIKKTNDMNFWVPGARTAALYAEWVEKNGGKVTIDKSKDIQGPPKAQKN